MSKYTSEIKIIPAAHISVWNRISDLSQLQTVKDNMPEEQKAMIRQRMDAETGGKVSVSNVSFTRDTASFTLSGMAVMLRIAERQEPMKCVKFTTENSPVEVTLWIQLLPLSAYETKCRVTIEVDIPFFLKPMVGKKLDGAADQIAEMLTRIPY